MLTFEQMKELLEMVAQANLGGVEVSGADFHFRVEGREITVATAAAPGNGAAPQVPVAANPEVLAAAVVPEVETGHVLTSPIVGTFYSSPSPEAGSYVTIGGRVEKGQVMCIVEAMKLMNEIEADVSGVVRKMFPQNAQPVEFGEPLFVIDTD